MSRSPTIDRVLRGQLCTGCGLCASIAGEAVEMEMVAPGYARPAQLGPVPAAKEAVIAATCPGAVVAEWGQEAPIHPYWGAWRRIATGHANDPDVRYQGSSGGALSGLMIYALEAGLVDRVIHVKADPDSPTRNVMACSRTPEDVIAGAGSRYTASSPLAQIDDVLSEGGSAAFIGKPCDVSGLRRLAKVDARVERHVPFMLSFFCGGMPSHDGVDRMLATMGVVRGDLASFRYRGRGWPGTAAATTRDGRVTEMSYAESWGGHLSKEVQFRCKICPDAVGGTADIACADAWYGGETGYPTFEEQDGRSLIISRSDAGERLLTGAVGAGAIAVEPLAIEEIDLMQPSQARRKRLVAARDAALVVTAQPRVAMGGTFVGAAARHAKPLEVAHNLAGTVRRIVLGRR